MVKPGTLMYEGSSTVLHARGIEGFTKALAIYS